MFGIAVTTAMTTPSTTFALVNTTATTLNFAGASTTINVGAAASATTWTGQSFSLTGANSTNNTSLTIQNTSNAAAASHAYQDIAVGGTTSTGDPHTRWTIPSGTSWYAGPDNSDSDTFKIGTGTAVGTNTLWSLTSGGAITEVPRTAAYQWTTWNPSDVAGTATSAPATAVTTSPATNYMTMANSSGTVTFTFTKAGRYLVTVQLSCSVGVAFTAAGSRYTITLGGTAINLITSHSPFGMGGGAAENSSVTDTFLVQADINETLTVLPRGSVVSGGVVGDFVFAANATATYVGE